MQRVVYARDWAGNWFSIHAAYPVMGGGWYVDSLFGGKFLTRQISNVKGTREL